MGGEKPPIHSWLSVGTGITPAWAGKRRCTRLDAGHRRDHPRVGGEKIKSGGPLDTARGSPPHRRGKVFLTDLVRIVVGITPAWAGKSPRLPDSKPAGKDHPRVGGEKIKAAARVGRCAGSPPRGRGKVRFVLLLAVLVGITPAWAGKSPCSSKLVNAFEDHPRVGGEKGVHLAVQLDQSGSPPRGRGKDSILAGVGLTKRITPAWAGKR